MIFHKNLEKEHLLCIFKNYVGMYVIDYQEYFFR